MVYKSKEEQMQLEMFPSAIRRQLTSDKFRNETLLKNPRLRYEKFIIFGMGFIITAAVFFSLGVEKGKSIIKANIIPSTVIINATPINTSPKVDTKTEIKSNVLMEKEKKPPSQQQVPPQKVLPAKIFPNKGTFTIQVATYRKIIHAQKAIESLKNKGFKTFFVPANNFVQLCVGKFVNKEEAKLALKELKKTYADCFIRRM